MRAVVLCGGVAKRMQPLREDKFTLDFLGRPLLLHQVEMLRQAGLREFVFVANGANVETVRGLVGSLKWATCHFAQQEEAAGMAGAVEAAQEYLDGPVLVVSSNDVVEAVAYSGVLHAAEQGDSAVLLLAYRVSQYFPGGYLVADGDMDVSRIVEKPGRDSEPCDLVNVVVHYHRDGRRLLEALGDVETVRDDRYECALNLLIADGWRVHAVPYGGFWGTLKFPWDVFAVMQHFLDRMKPSVAATARVAESAVLEGNVVLGDGARVLENAVIRGPAYIGDGVVIGNNALIRGGVHIGAGSVVGYSTEVKHSYVGRDCWFHSNYIGDSIIDDGCSFGSGAVTANLRLDGDGVQVLVDGERYDTGIEKLGVIMGRGCRLGINVSLMPGVRVGPGAFVGPHVCLTSDLGAGMKAMPLTGYEVTEGNGAAAGSERDAPREKLEEA